MRIQAFIFNWPGKKQHAAKLERMFRPHCEVIVINSDDSLRTRYPHWQHIGNDGYFTEQWNAALQRFNADIFVHIQGDIWPTKIGQVLSECTRFIKNYGVGAYAPNDRFHGARLLHGSRCGNCRKVFTKYPLQIIPSERFLRK